jgi:hypothetical protein
VQLAVADVDCDHARRAALEQHVSEPAGGCAHVEAVAPAQVDAERVQRVCKLLAAARDVRRRGLELEFRLLVDLRARLRVTAHAPRQDKRLCLRARIREPALYQENVESLLHSAVQM